MMIDDDRCWQQKGIEDYLLQSGAMKLQHQFALADG